MNAHPHQGTNWPTGHDCEEMFRELAEQSSEGFWFVALDPERVLYASPAMEVISGIAAERLCQDPRAWLDSVHEEEREHITRAWESFVMGVTSEFEEEYRVVSGAGAARWVVTRGTHIHDDSGVLTRVSGVTRDVTSRRELEAQFRHAQKMESVGRLAGSLAHDFNNLLTVIIGMAELVLQGLDETHALRPDLEEIHRAGERGADLTRQLLTFSRKEVFEPQVINLNAVVIQTEALIRRLLTEDVQLVFELAEGLENTRADAGQMEQVLLNLTVNARDAMPQGGRMAIQTRNVQIDQQLADERGALTPGAYVLLAVTDTGHGMDEATIRQIFQPFFTTKPPGKGTGLGLSTVYEIIEHSRGVVIVESSPGAGTTFQMYLPAAREEMTAGPVAQPSVFGWANDHASR